MDSIETSVLEKRVWRRARVAYELGRLRLALLGVLPMALVVVVAVWTTHRPQSALCFGAATLLAGATMIWYGRDPQKAVLPGVVAGIIPLGLALAANHLHVCGPGGCTSLCVPACTLGGVLSGLLVARAGQRRHAGFGFWLSASGLALLTGAMGCACLGYSGLAGLGIGFLGGSLPGLLRRVRRDGAA